MTPKEKAEELINRYLKCNFKYSDYEGDKWTKEFSIHEAKQCALIAVDEIINTGSLGSIYEGWWQQVRNEIEKL